MRDLCGFVYRVVRKGVLPLICGFFILLALQVVVGLHEYVGTLIAGLICIVLVSSAIFRRQPQQQQQPQQPQQRQWLFQAQWQRALMYFVVFSVTAILAAVAPAYSFLWMFFIQGLILLTVLGVPAWFNWGIFRGWLIGLLSAQMFVTLVLMLSVATDALMFWVIIALGLSGLGVLLGYQYLTGPEQMEWGRRLVPVVGFATVVVFTVAFFPAWWPIFRPATGALTGHDPAEERSAFKFYAERVSNQGDDEVFVGPPAIAAKTIHINKQGQPRFVDVNIPYQSPVKRLATFASGAVTKIGVLMGDSPEAPFYTTIWLKIIFIGIAIWLGALVIKITLGILKF